MFKRQILFIFLLSFFSINIAIAHNGKYYALAKIPTPVLNTSDFSFVFGGKDRRSLHKDDSGLMRELEFIALPYTVFNIEDTIIQNKNIIYQVTTPDYLYGKDKQYFIDSRFVNKLNYKPIARKKILPKYNEIIDKLIALNKSRYIWGGNYAQGIKELLLFYPPKANVDNERKEQWILKGVDCSGLLYQATNGFTPRNASALLKFGKSLAVENLNPEAIINKLEPLDLIVWDKHIIIVLDKKNVIESRQYYTVNGKKVRGGVRIEAIKATLKELLSSRIAVNDYFASKHKDKKRFVIRRWYK